jgi:hypothetical protein
MFCFTVKQSRIIAQELSNGWYSDSIANAYASQEEVFNRLIVEKGPDVCPGKENE